MKYKSLVACAALSFIFVSSPSQAVTLDFGAFIDGGFGEQAFEGQVTVNGVSLTARGYSGGTAPVAATVGSLDTAPFAYYDGGQAGIGVCRALTGTQCNPNSDDNVTGFNGNLENEVLGIDFNAGHGVISITQLAFLDANHGIAQFDGTDTIDFSVDSGVTWDDFFIPMNGIVSFLVAITVGPQDQLLLAHNDQQFYLSAATVTGPNGGPPPSIIPLPAALPLFGTSLGLLGFLGWRRRRRNQVL